MSNLLLKTLRERGIIAGEVVPFASPANARSLAERTQRAVVILDGANSGDYWVVDPHDAQRLVGAGYELDPHGPPLASGKPKSP